MTPSCIHDSIPPDGNHFLCTAVSISLVSDDEGVDAQYQSLDRKVFYQHALNLDVLQDFVGELQEAVNVKQITPQQVGGVVCLTFTNNGWLVVNKHVVVVRGTALRTIDIRLVASRRSYFEENRMILVIRPLLVLRRSTSKGRITRIILLSWSSPRVLHETDY